jgi:hypothetical protein
MSLQNKPPEPLDSLGEPALRQATPEERTRMIKQLKERAQEMGVAFDTESRNGFEKDLEDLINKYNRESGSNTPDFILANYLIGCLATFNMAVTRRDEWYAPPSKTELPPSKGRDTGEGYVPWRRQL